MEIEKTQQDIKPKIGKFLYYFFMVFAIIMLLNALTSRSDKMFNLIGFRTYTVLSGSMEPEFYPGDLVVTINKNKVDIEKEDIITFVDNGEIVTHRVMEITNEGYKTKGDNNDVYDPDIIKKDNVIGEVKFSIPKMGYVAQFLSNPMVIAAEMFLLALFIIIINRD
ncbi:signal peptidase I [Romboutsia sp. 1001216sp1]|uniref:signal peptidase I n=1 Tax=Romboutsia sp. 1001216sp1 TaxID=2986997 RepID=UPI0023301FA8|nr:signal peptidase I [Romboutsia sp. 1001216sp1]MDB8804730.1 signal peptidase I [Romboutsia sp. 1001216sp1]MDB8806346.1 signal peptidase I [Romboutsia sp. 1001216sp1]MDB8810376.1 signal peptidase I [Romboutsia sp. 1001216sp1]MDB8817534.1 signal peptidase I [Romboutsia sp. 1001216sp1]MDB8818573.1 signal peptidase I [Romboutsia sp. 1001216sp1]